MRRARAALLAPVLSAALGACAHAPATPAGGPLPAWPPPPAAPRIRFLSSFAGDAPRDAPWWRRALGAVAGIDATAPEARAPLRPFGVAIDGSALLVADPEAGEVREVDWRGGTSRRVACKGRPWSAPIAVAAGAGHRWVADAGAAEVVRVAPDGTCAAVGAGRLGRPTALAFAGGLLYVVDTPAHEIAAFSPDGAEVRRFGGRGDEPSRLNFPTGICTAPDGTLLVVDALHFRVARFGQDGGYLGEIAGDPDGPAALLRPKGIAALPDGRVLVTDSERGVVLAFAPGGAFLFAFGGIGGGPGELELPAGVAAGDGRVFVGDPLGGRVEIYEVLGDRS